MFTKEIYCNIYLIFYYISNLYGEVPYKTQNTQTNATHNIISSKEYFEKKCFSKIILQQKFFLDTMCYYTLTKLSVLLGQLSHLLI